MNIELVLEISPYVFMVMSEVCISHEFLILHFIIVNLNIPYY